MEESNNTPIRKKSIKAWAIAAVAIAVCIGFLLLLNDSAADNDVVQIESNTANAQGITGYTFGEITMRGDAKRIEQSTFYDDLQVEMERISMDIEESLTTEQLAGFKNDTGEFVVEVASGIVRYETYTSYSYVFKNQTAGVNYVYGQTLNQDGDVVTLEDVVGKPIDDAKISSLVEDGLKASFPESLAEDRQRTIENQAGSFPFRVADKAVVLTLPTYEINQSAGKTDVTIGVDLL